MHIYDTRPWWLNWREVCIGLSMLSIAFAPNSCKPLLVHQWSLMCHKQLSIQHVDIFNIFHQWRMFLFEYHVTRNRLATPTYTFFMSLLWQVFHQTYLDFPQPWTMLDWYHSWMINPYMTGSIFSKCDFIFWCCSPYVQFRIVLYETGPIQWMF